MQDLAPGDTILLNDNPAGHQDVLRRQPRLPQGAYVEDVGVKTVYPPTSTSSPNASNSVPSNP